MTKLFVDYDYVNSTAAKSINDLKAKYHDYWTEVFNQFQKIDTAWDGVDNEEFNNKFASLRHDFEAMDNYLTSLYNYLIKAAEDYKNQQTSVQNAAKQLRS